MDIIRLRVLSRKSYLGFGKYKDLSIQQILNFEKAVYLRWVYYNMESISFLPDILDEIHIKDNDIINKPGKDPERFLDLQHKIRLFVITRYGAMNLVRQDSHNKLKRKLQAYCKNKAKSKSYFKKSVLCNANRKIKS